MKLVDKKKEKILNEELNKLLTVLPLMKFEDKRRITVLNQIQLINRILKPHNDTGDNATKTNVSPLEEFMKQQKNETVSKKEPQRSKYSRV